MSRALRAGAWVGFALVSLLFFAAAMYQQGFSKGAVSCKPAAPIQRDLKRMTIRAEANFIRWWKARGGA